MLNQDQAKHDNEELRRDAVKSQIREALKNGPGRAKELAERIGQESNGEFVSILHEMEDAMEISFSWLVGYKL